MAEHDKRVEKIGRFLIPPKGTDARKSFDAWHVEQRNNPDFSRIMADARKLSQQLVSVQQENGAGLPLDMAIREFHGEYNSRIVQHGLDKMPSSFNVLEAFLEYLPPLSVFSIRPERDHIFALTDFLEFVTSDAPQEP